MSDAEAQETQEGGPLLVNKRELATQILKCSLPTVASLMDKYPDFPVHQRGANGVEWLFDAVAVTEFLEQKREEDRRASEAKSEFFKQFSLPIDNGTAPGATELTPSQRMAMAKARREERKLALETGMLISKAEMRQVLTGSMAKLGRFLDTLSGQVAKRHALPEEVARSMRSFIDEQRRVFVTEIKEVLEAEAAANGDD
ncbi:MAG: terminase small subunit [Clostridiaceae bacterium]|nr:terminase small subunit [Clostridiaceae bacterium]